MNKIFKVIWSKSKQCYIVVSEIAKNKTGKKKIVVASILAALAMAGTMQSVDAAIPEGNATGNDAFAIGPQSNVNGAFGFAIGNNAKFNSGTLGFAIGVNSEATSNQSIAIGYLSKAAGRNIGGGGDPALAVGAGAKATEGGATAIGMVANASNTFATAIGKSAAASGDSSIAIGQNTKATQEKAIAIGDASQATNIGATALGRSSEATRASATALGSLASATGTLATAVGMQASASGNESLAIGTTASATSGRSLAVGTNAKATGENSVAVGSGAGGSGPRGFASSINSSGSVVNSLKTINYATTADGDNAVALGFYANAKNSGVAVGQNALAATGGVAIGKGVLEDTSNHLAGGVAIGQDSASTGAYSLAMGRHAFASGSTSMAIGYEASANGNFAVAMGRNVTATGTSTAIGRHAVASNGGLAIGSQENDASNDRTTASAKGAVAIGKNANATSEDAVAIGTNAQATLQGAVALGSGSTTATGATSQGSTTINGITYNFAGATGNPNMQVSVGSAGATRQIKNVAAGEVSATSTDAINGSQLYAVARAVKPLKYVSVNSAAAGTGSNVDNDGAQGGNSIAIGPSSTVTRQNGIAIGSGAQSLSEDSVVIGRDAKAETKTGAGLTTTSRAIVIGSNSRVAADVTQGVAIGSGLSPDEGAVVTGDQSIAIGGNVKVDGHSAIAIGGDDARKAANQLVSYTNTDDTEVTGTLQTAIQNLTGYNLSNYKGTTASHAGVAYGTSALAGNAGVAIGTAADSMTRMNDKGQVVNNKPVTNAVAIGTGARANFDNSVAIGGGSNTDHYATKQVNAVIDGVEVKWSGGENISPGDVVSFGAKGFERQLKNVAPGEVSQTSTDAINGSQIYSLARKITNIMNGGAGSVVNVNASGEPLTKVVTGTGASKVEKYYRTVDVKDDGTLVTGAIAQTPTSLSLVNVDQTNVNQQTQVPRTLSNVADGVKDNDAVNVSQLNAAKVKYFSVNSTVTGNRDNTGATGVNAIAIGPAATATKAQSIALGNSATAGGTDSIAIGNGSVAADKVAPVAIGRGTQANGDFSVALGGGNHQFVGAIANGVGTTALGTYTKTTAGENFQTAVGFGANTTKSNATAIGYNSAVSTEGGVALGANSSSSTGRIVGYNPNDGRTNTYSALTGNVIRSTTGAVAVGNGTEVTRQITGVAAGTNDTDAVNVAQLKSVNLAFVGDSGFGDVNLANNDTTKRFAVKGDSTYLTTRANGNLITVSANKKDISVTNGTATAAAGMADAKNVAEAINKAVSQNAYTWNLTADNDTAGSRSTINKEGTVKFSGDQNITVARNGNTITSSLNKSIIVDSVKANNSVTTGSGSNQITLDGTTGAVTGNTFSGQSFTAGDNVLSNTTLQIGSPTNGNNVTITKDGLTSKAGTKTAKFGANGIDAGGQQITNVSSGGNVGTNAANITDVKNAVSDVTLKLDTNSKTGTVKLSESPLKVIGANGIRTDLIGTNNGSLVVGLDSNTVNATTKGIGLTGDTGSTGLKYLKDGDASFKVAGDGNLVTTKASATGVQVAVDTAKVKDLAVEAVTVSKANTSDNPITVTPTAGTNSKDYAIGIDTTKLASKTDLTYRANNDADANAQKVSLAKGLNFVNGDNTVATVAADGKVSYDLNAATKTKIDESATAVARNISLGADSGTASSQSLKDGDVAFNVKGATGDYVSTNMNGNTVEVSTKRATINSDANTGAASVTGNDGLATAKNVADAINKAADAAKAGAAWNLTTNSSTTDKTSVQGGDTVDLINGDNIVITQDGTDKKKITVATKKDLTVDSVTAGNTVINTSGLTNGTTAITGSGITTDKVTVGGISIDKTDGINAGGKAISNVASGGTTDTNAANIGDVKQAVANLSQNLNITDGANNGTVDLKNQKLNVAGANGVTATVNNQTITVGLDANTVNATTKGIGLTADTGSTGNKYLKDGDVSFAVTGDGNLVSTSATAAGVKVAVDAAKVKDLAVDAVTVSKDAQADNPITVTPTAGTNSKDYAIGIDTTKLAAKTDLTYRANNDTDANAKKVSLAKGLNFVNGTLTTASIDTDGVVKYDVNTATITAGADGTVTGPTTDGVATAQNVADAINAAKKAAKTEITANTGEAANATTGNVTLTSTTAADGYTIYDVKLNDKMTLGTGTNAVTIDGTAGKATVGTVVVDGVNNTITTGGASPVTLDGATGTITGKTANIGGVTVNGTTNDITGLSNTTVTGADFATKGRAATEEQLKAVTSATALKFTGDVATNTGSINLKDDTFGIKGDGKYITTDVNGKDVNLTVSEAEVKKSAVAAVTVSTDTTDANNPISVTPTTSADGTTKDYKVTIDGTKIANKTNLSYKANDGTAKQVSLADGLNFKNGTLTTASIDDAGVVKYDVNTAAITAGTDGTVTGPTTDGVATAQNVADAINAAKKAAKTEITANTGEAANATTGNVTLTSTTAADGHTIYDVKLNDKVTLGTGANAVTIDGTAGKATVGTAVVDGVNNTITTGGASPVTLDGATGTITGKTANIGGVTVNGTTNDITGLSNTTVTGADFATKGRAATEEQLKAVTSATALKFTGDVATNTGSINLKDDTFGIKGDGKYITTDVNGKDVNLTVSEAEVKKSAVAAVTVSTDTTDANNPISVTPTTSADGTTKDYKVTIDGTKIANKTNLSYKANDGTAKQVSLADGLNFKNGTLTTASIDDAGVVKYDVNTAAITAGTDGTITGPTTDGVATAQNVADAINAAKKASKTEITANTGEAANATTGNVTLTSTTAADGHTIYDVKLNDKVTLGTGANAVTIDGTAGKITAKNAAIGGVTVDGDNSHVTGLSNTTWNGTATTGRAATEDQLKAVADTAKATTDAVNLKFSGDTNTSAGVVNLKDDTFNIVGDGKYVTTDANGKDLTVKVSEAEVKKSAVAAVTVSTDTTDANNPISVTPTTSADGTTKDYKVTIDGTKIANKTNLSYKANDGTAKQVSLADGLNFKNGTLTTASIDDAGVVKYDVNTATITAGTDGTITGPTTDGVATAQNVADAINAAKKAAKTEITANTGEAANATTGNVTLTSTTAADGHTIYDVKLNDTVTLGTGANAVTIDGTAGKATVGTAVVDGVNNTITTGGANAVALDGVAGTVKTGTVTLTGGTTNDITGLSNTTVNAADFATKGRAATEEQLKAVGEQTWQITADKDATTSGTQTGTKKDAKVGKDDKVQLIAGENLTVNQNERDFTYSLNKDLVKMNSATFEATGGKTTVITGDSIAQTDGTKTNTSTAAGNTVADGTKSTETTAAGQVIKDGAKTNTSTVDENTLVDGAKSNKTTVDSNEIDDGNGNVNTSNATSNTITDGTNTSTISAGKAQIGTVGIDGVASNITTGGANAVVLNGADGTVKTGTVILTGGTTNDITGLSNTTVNSPDFATRGRAATEEQLKAVGEQTWQITADKDAATSGNQTGTKKDAKVGKDDKVQLIAGENLTVNQNERDFTYSLNKDLVKMNSATFEATGGKTTVITGDSIAQTDGTKTNRSTAAGNTVADGTKSTETTAAGQVIKDGAKTNTSTVDENTLVDGAKSNKTTVDSNVIDDGNGNVNTSNATSNTITDGTNTSTITAGKATIGSSIIDGVNNTFTTGGANAVTLDGAAGTVKAGTVTVTGGTTNDITGLSNTTVNSADFATKGRAATEEQLKAVGEQTWQITADKDAATSGNQTGTKKDAKVGKDDKVQLIAGENLTVNQNERDFTYSLNKDLVKMNSATFEATGGKTTVITGDSIAQTDGTKTNRSTAAGNTVADGGKSTATTADGTTVTNGADSTATTAAGTTVTSANGNTNYAADGVRINTTGKNPVSLTDAGLDNGNNVIKNVASGHVNNDDTDNTNAANIADVKKATTTVTANNGEAANSTTGNVTLTSTTAADGHTIYDVKLKDTVTLGTGANAVTIDGTAGKATIGSSVVDGVNNTITTGGANAVALDGAAGTVKTGTVIVTGGTTNDITGLSNTTVNAADFATKGRAATEEQLKAVGEQTWQITADKDAATSGNQTGTKKDAKVGKDDKVQLIAGENLTVNQNERDFTYSLNKDLVKMNSATFEATGGKTTVITGDSIAQTDGTNTNTSTAAGNTVADGGKSTATTADGTTVTNGADSTATTAAGTTVTSANGNTNYAADGVRINTTGKNPVSLTDAGLDNGNNVIKNVASGHVNNDDTDNTNAANIADVKKATTTVTANNGEAANATTGNVTLTSTTAADGYTIYDVKLNDKVTLGTGANAVTIDGTAGKATIGSSVVDGVNNTITTGGANAVTMDGAAGTVKTGTVTVTGGTTNDITGLSNTTVNSADFATKGRAATEEQLKQVGEQTWQITADKDAATSGAQTGTKKDAKVGKDDKVQLIAGENLTVNQNERDFTYSLNKDLVKMNSATFEATGGKTTVITGDSIAQTDGTKTNRSTAAGNTVADGTKSTETTAAGQVIKDGAKTNTSTVDENTLVDGAKSNKTTVDSNVIDDGNGNVNTSNATSNTITDGTNTSTITAGKATIGSSIIDGVNKTFTTGGANAVKLDGVAGTVKTGTVTVTGGTTNDITGLSNTTVNSADFATKGRAATEEQLKQVGEQTWQITADKDAATSGAQTGTKKDAKVGKDDKVQLIAGENLTVNQNERDFTYSLNKDLVKMNSATFEATGGKTTVITGDSIAQTDGTKTNRSTAAGNTITDGTNTTEATASTLTVKDNAGNSTVITKDTITTGTGANKVTVDGTVGKVTAGSAVVDGVNNTITTGGANTVKLDGAAGTVTGLTNTAWTPGVTKAVSGRAATEDQLQQVSDAVGAGWNINSGTVTGSTGEANGSAKTKVSSGEEVQLQAGNNLIIDQNGKTLAYSLNKNLKDMESARFNATGGKTTVIKGDSIVQTDGGKTNTSNAAGNTVVDGTKSTATTAAGTTITDGAKTNTNTADKNVIDDGAGNTNTSNATSNTIADPNGNMNTATATSNTLADNAGNSNVSNATSNNLTDNAGNSNVSNATSNTLKNAAGDETKIDAKGTTVKDSAGNTTNVAATGATVTNAAGDTTKVEATGTTVADAAGNKATFTKDGVTITKPGKDTVSLTGNGLDNGNNKIVNVADGTNDTDAVNVRQLDAKTKAATTELTANGGESADNTTGNIVLTKTTAPDGHIIYDNKLNDKITLGAADPTKAITVDGTNGTIKAGKDGNAVAINGTDGTIKAGDGTNAVAIDGVNGSVKVADKIALNGKDGKAAIGTVGIDGKDGIITTGGNNPVAVNGKDGVLTGLTNKTWDPNNITSGRAATEDQVQSAVANAGWDATVGTEGSGVNSTPNATPEKIRPNETLTFKAGNNMMVSHAGKTISYAVNPELTDMKSATFKDAAGNTTVTDGNGITITPGSANPNNPNAGPVSLTKDGLNNGNNQIKGVAPGSDDTDAVNIGQLKVSNAKIGDAIGQVAGEVQRVGAHAAAMAALKPIQYDPLEPTQVMAGVGNYRGETAAALGLAHYTNENTMFNVGVSVGGNHNMVNAGVTHKFGYSPEKKNIPDRYKAGPISSVYVMQDEVSSLKKENAEQKYVIADQAARLNTLEAENERQRQELAETKQGLDDLRAAVDKLLASKG